tara:strand:+ start:23612 stop:23881 length:270 start_codon:yes stop_codon:yes gene_type:complete
MKTENMTTAAVAVNPKPLGAEQKRKYRIFDVSTETFSRFQRGRTRYERWSKFINEDEKNIVSYYNKNKDAVIVLRNSENGAMRALYHAK